MSPSLLHPRRLPDTARPTRRERRAAATIRPRRDPMPRMRWMS
ncbi:MAG TPA: hypothetical protein VN238_07765 [Solirubrobacteraceae bacterium]|nr:hypothetical protein [Solirubrobacteraceae bacterium]